MWQNRTTNEKLLIIFGGLVIVAALLDNASPFLIILLLLAVAAFRSRTQDDREDESYEYDYKAEREDSRHANANTVHQHALGAVRRAGLDAERLKVLPVDIGMMAFKEDNDPVIHRTWPVSDDNDYVQPFVQLRVPQVAIGQIRFELVDRYDQQVFVHEDNYQLERGRNLVIPTARLPLHDEQSLEGGWELHVYADGMLLASHPFDWENSESPDFERHIGEDGEINSELRAVLADNRLGEMSLDDLLAYQDQEADEAEGQDQSARR